MVILDVLWNAKQLRKNVSLHFDAAPSPHILYHLQTSRIMLRMVDRDDQRGHNCVPEFLRPLCFRERVMDFRERECHHWNLDGCWFHDSRDYDAVIFCQYGTQV
jgi:hypothetical protein